MPAVPVVLCGSFLGSFFAGEREEGIFRTLALKFTLWEKLKVTLQKIMGEEIISDRQLILPNLPVVIQWEMDIPKIHFREMCS